MYYSKPFLSFQPQYYCCYFLAVSPGIFWVYQLISFLISFSPQACFYLQFLTKDTIHVYLLTTYKSVRISQGVSSNYIFNRVKCACAQQESLKILKSSSYRAFLIITFSVLINTLEWFISRVLLCSFTVDHIAHYFSICQKEPQYHKLIMPLNMLMSCFLSPNASYSHFLDLMQFPMQHFNIRND